MLTDAARWTLVLWSRVFGAARPNVRPSLTNCRQLGNDPPSIVHSGNVRQILSVITHNEVAVAPANSRDETRL
jgi:hypothetical protein